ncbi:MAG: NTP transferase domain-containing protein [Elusimicrobia bacterium]|nr:NTP transferase domain-containing protein [Elusimicrobiota bacterium]
MANHPPLSSDPVTAYQVYLLAAGRGERAGGPKAWRPYQGRSLLEKQLEFLLAEFSPEKIGISIQEAWKERCSQLHSQIHWIPVDPEAAPLGTLQTLLKLLPLRNWGFVYHVDMPVWEPRLFDVIRRQIASARQNGTEAIVPIYKGRRGHPVLLSPPTQSALLVLDPATARLDDWLRGQKVQTVEVPWGCILENWNQPGWLRP